MIEINGVEPKLDSVEYHGGKIQFMENDEWGKEFVHEQIDWEDNQINSGNPPFRVGDKVRIESVNNGGTEEKDLKMYREVQIVSDITPMPVNGGVEWWISLRNMKYIFMPENLKLA